MIQWRDGIFRRDHYTCQVCKRQGGTLNAHHIKKFSAFPLERLNPRNGITLCCSCHSKVHKNEKIYTTYFYQLLNLTYSNMREVISE